MPKCSASLVGIAIFFLLTGTASAQVPPSPKPAKDHPSPFSSESFVVQSLQTKIRFESDGTGSREVVARIHIQSEAALRSFGLLAFSYNHSSESLDILYVRCRKPDGTVMPTPLADIQDLDSEITRNAPMYTDQREKHIAVKSLSVGDTVEYDMRWTILHPVAPGHFWFSDNFPLVAPRTRSTRSGGGLGKGTAPRQISRYSIDFVQFLG